MIDTDSMIERVFLGLDPTRSRYCAQTAVLLQRSCCSTNVNQCSRRCFKLVCIACLDLRNHSPFDFDLTVWRCHADISWISAPSPCGQPCHREASTVGGTAANRGADTPRQGSLCQGRGVSGASCHVMKQCVNSLQFARWAPRVVGVVASRGVSVGVSVGGRRHWGSTLGFAVGVQAATPLEPQRRRPPT